MKKMVRFISVVMVIVMMFSMTASGFADRVAVTGGGTTIYAGTGIVGGGSKSSGNSGSSISAGTRPSHYTAPDGSMKTTTSELNVSGTAEAPKYLGNGDIDYEALVNSEDVNIAGNADFIMYVHDHLDDPTLQNDGTVETAYAIFGSEVIEGDAFEEDEVDQETCEHEWIEATCTAAKTCSKCKTTEGEPLAHSYVKNENGIDVCSVCGVARCEAEGHAWGDNGDGTRTCAVCGLQEGQHEHSFSEATCTEGEICSCGETRGDALGHNFQNGSCARCGAADPDASAQKTPVESPVPEAPAETPAQETPVESPVPEAPAETPAQETPVESPLPEVPAETPVPTEPEQLGPEGEKIEELSALRSSGAAVVIGAKSKVIHAQSIAYTGAKSNKFAEVCSGHGSLINSLGTSKLVFTKAFDICNSTDYRLTINLKGTEIVAPAGGYAFVINDGADSGINGRVSSVTFTNGSITGNGFYVETNGVLNLGGLVNNKVDVLVNAPATAVYVENGGTAVIGEGTQLYSAGGNTVEIEAGGQVRMSGGIVAVNAGDNGFYAVNNNGTFLLNASGYDFNNSNGVVKNEGGVAVMTATGAATTIGAGSVIGQTGIAVDAGSLLMYNGTVTGTGAFSETWPKTGSAIAARQTSQVTISGGALRSEKSAAIIDCDRHAKNESTNITLFSESIITQQAAGMVSDYVVAKFTMNDVGFASMGEAIKAANISEDTTKTIRMGGDYEMQAADAVEMTANGIVFDLNGYELFVPASTVPFAVSGGSATIKNGEIKGAYGHAGSCFSVSGGDVTVGSALTINSFLTGIDVSGGNVYVNDVYMPNSVQTGINCTGGNTLVAMITDDCDIPVNATTLDLLRITGGWFKRDVDAKNTPATKVSAYVDPSQSHLKWVEKDKYFEVLYNNEPTVTLISPTTATVSGDKTYIEYDKNIYEANGEPLIFEFDAGCVQVDAVSYNAAKTVYPLFTCETKDSKGGLVGASGKVRVADLSVLKDLPAGAYDLVFTFANGAKITDKLVLKVYPAVFMAFKVPNSRAMSNLEAGAVKEYVVDDNRLYKNGYDVDDEENILVLMSELPEKVAVGSNSFPYGEDVNQKTYIEYYINGSRNGDGTVNSDPNFNGTCMKIPASTSYGTYAPGNYAFFISYADLNNLVPGQNYVFADYGDSLYSIEKSSDEYASVVEAFNMSNAGVYITPSSVKWSTLSGNATFTVKPDILNSDAADCASVYLDGECVPRQYWTYDKASNNLTFKTEYLKELPREVHSLDVITSNGKVGATIETNAGLAPKNLDYHVYGGGKSLSFVSSDKIDKEKGVWIGSANPVKLDPSCYVWDSDNGFTLSAAFLNRLNLGTYYISAYVWDGTEYVYRTTSFKVISATQASYNPSTGDENNIKLYIAILVLSAIAIVVILLPKFKKNGGKENTAAAKKKEKK